jgi:hypothetical protein
VRSFKAFLLIDALFLVILVALYVCARCLLQVEEGSLFVALKIKSSKEARDEERAVRVAFRWRKASVPNHLLPMIYIQDYYALIGTWSDHLGRQYYHKTYGSVLAN